MKKALKDFFTYSSRERTGMVVLLMLVIVAMAANILLRYFPCRSVAREEAVYVRELEHFRDSLSRIESGSDAGRDETRLTGGRSGFPDWDREKESAKAGSLHQTPRDDPGQRRSLPAQSTFRRKILVEINTADSAALKQLRGIGPVLASRIMKYRSLLGGYHSVDQLTEVYGISDSLCDALREYIYTDSSLIRRIPVNESGETRLGMHPYIGKYRARAIVAYREYAGTISGIDELVKNKIIPEESREKVEMYLDFDIEEGNR